MPVQPNQFPLGLTARQIADVITEGEGHAWNPAKTPDIVKDLARKQKGEARTLLDNRGITVGTAETRLYCEDQIVVALVHLILRELGPTPAAVAHKISEALLGPGYGLGNPSGNPKKTPAQKAIDQWRAGERGFAFCISYHWDRSTDRRSWVPDHACALIQGENVPFKPSKDRIPLAFTKIELDHHLMRIFGG